MNDHESAHPAAYGFGLGVGCLLGVLLVAARHYTGAVLNWAGRRAWGAEK